MSHLTGEELGIELAQATLCGKSIFPRAAEFYVDRNHAVVAGEGEEALFHRQGEVYPGDLTGATGNVSGPVYPSWSRLRDEYQRIMAESADNLYATGAALVRAAEVYASTDQVAAQRLKNEEAKYAGQFPFPRDKKVPVQPE